ncbi:MAG: glycosyltransferase WbuB [Planctomycetota bacterium]
MRMLYVSAYFPPEMGAPSARVSELAREWVNLGHDVTVLTGFANHPTGIKAPEDRGVVMRRERSDGIDVVRAYLWAAPNKGLLKRMLSYASFMFSAAAIGALRVRRPEVVVATSPHLLCGLAGYFLARRFGVPFVFEVRDLWPESILAVQAMQDNVLIRVLTHLAAFLYAQADRIVTVGEGYKRGIVARYGVDPEKIAVIPNGIEAALWKPGSRENSLRRERGWEDRYVALYAGTHGMAHALQAVLQSARLLEQRCPKLRIVFVGEGAEKAALQAQAARWKLSNVEFVDQQPKARLAEYYAACDVGLVTLRDTPLFQEVLPSKIFEYLAMERPIVLSVGGEARELIEAAGCGVYVPPEDPEALARTLEDCVRCPLEWAARGRSCRVFVLERFDRSAQARKYVDLLMQILNRA